jgi:[histone H3]-lysine79 N-trimethyltransferase
MSKLNRFRLLKPVHDSHGYQALSDIAEVMHKVAEYYLPESIRSTFDDEGTGYPQRLQRAVNKKVIEDVKSVLEEYNTALLQLVKDGTISKVLDQQRVLHATLAERILNQAYSRTVSPNLKLLRKYQAGTDNVYGELLPRFVSTIIKKDLGLKSSDVFVDLGSGVGNVVLQAALEVGCESWGCEMMKEYCAVADLQHKEFIARCRLWGLHTGSIHLEKGDFLENSEIKSALRRADAVLVNNQVFTPSLNEALTNLFLDLKEGCKVVSLKSFVPADHKITARNVNSAYNVLSVEKKRYFSNCVSWTNEGGSYYISTKDSTRVESFFKGRH